MLGNGGVLANNGALIDRNGMMVGNNGMPAGNNGMMVGNNGMMVGNNGMPAGNNNGMMVGNNGAFLGNNGAVIQGQGPSWWAPEILDGATQNPNVQPFFQRYWRENPARELAFRQMCTAPVQDRALGLLNADYRATGILPTDESHQTALDLVEQMCAHFNNPRRADRVDRRDWRMQQQRIEEWLQEFPGFVEPSLLPEF